MQVCSPIQGELLHRHFLRWRLYLKSFLCQDNHVVRLWIKHFLGDLRLGYLLNGARGCRIKHFLLLDHCFILSRLRVTTNRRRARDLPHRRQLRQFALMLGLGLSQAQFDRFHIAAAHVDLFLRACCLRVLY